MEYDSELAAAIFERSIAQHEQRLANAQASNNTRLASRVQRELDRLLEQKQKMTGVPVARASGHKGSKRRARGSRPNLKDEGTVVDPNGERWMELVGYVQDLDEHFPNEHLSDRCGLFSTEREFARYIREIESRIAEKD
jgi:hypothetical protein